jgi:hypothetical protein
MDRQRVGAACNDTQMYPRVARAGVPEALVKVVVPPAGPRAPPAAPGTAGPPRLREPPEFRAHPLAPAGTCVNCGGAAAHGSASSRCWECGRALCRTCYWRHGLAPADHRCAGCAVRSASVSVSGGRAAPPSDR